MRFRSFEDGKFCLGAAAASLVSLGGLEGWVCV